MKPPTKCVHDYVELPETYHEGISTFRCCLCKGLLPNQVVNFDAIEPVYNRRYANEVSPNYKENQEEKKKRKALVAPLLAPYGQFYTHHNEDEE